MVLQVSMIHCWFCLVFVLKMVFYIRLFLSYGWTLKHDDVASVCTSWLIQSNVDVNGVTKIEGLALFSWWVWNCFVIKLADV